MIDSFKVMTDKAVSDVWVFFLTFWDDAWIKSYSVMADLDSIQDLFIVAIKKNLKTGLGQKNMLYIIC